MPQLIIVGIVVFLIILGLSFGLLLIFSFFLILYWQLRSKNSAKLPDIIEKENGKLTQEESNELEYYKNLLKESENELEELYIQAGNLPIRKDGYFSERSALGKELNQEINYILRGIFSCQSKISEIEKLPKRRLDKWLLEKAKWISEKSTLKVDENIFYIYIIILFVLSCIEYNLKIDFFDYIRTFIIDISWDPFGMARKLSINKIFSSLLFSLIIVLIYKYIRVVKYKNIFNELLNEYNFANYNLIKGSLEDIQNDIDDKKFLILNYIVTLLAYVSTADGRISKNELSIIKRFIVVNAFDEEERSELSKIFNATKSGKIESYEIISSKLYNVISENFGEKRQNHYLKFISTKLFSLVYADNEMNLPQCEIVRNILKNFNLSDNQIEMFNNEYIQEYFNNEEEDEIYSDTTKENEEVPEDYKILDCKPSDSDEDLKKAYRNLAKKYHPDTLQGKGLPEEIIKMSSDKFAQINTAYENIKKMRSIN